MAVGKRGQLRWQWRAVLRTRDPPPTHTHTKRPAPKATHAGPELSS